MGRKSRFTAAQKCDAVMGVISQRKTVSETLEGVGDLRDDVRAVA